MNAFEFRDAAPKVLIADDDPIVIGSLADRCRRMGFVVDPGTSGRSALIKSGQATPDLSLSKLDGRWPQLLDRERSSLHVVVIQGRAAETLKTSHILKGSTFWNKFDMVLAEAFSLRQPVVKTLSAKPQIIKRPRVLLVDDDIDIRGYIFLGLRKLGIEPSFAADGTLGFWQAKRNPPAVIVSDYFMPNGNAERFLARLRSTPETENIPVIVQSGRELSGEIKKRLQGEVCGQAGASMVLKKSLGALELFGNLEVMCGLIEKAPPDSPDDPVDFACARRERTSSPSF